jgi:hypothetical protein
VEPYFGFLLPLICTYSWETAELISAKTDEGEFCQKSSSHVNSLLVREVVTDTNEEADAIQRISQERLAKCLRG